MSIDSGQNITYNAGFPVPNVDQSSQQFRDNFLITKVAIERLQNAASTPNSVLKLNTSLVANTTTVQIDAQYSNNALILPMGDPTAAPASGMIRYNVNSSDVDFYAGGAWHPLVYLTSNVATVPSLVVTTKATVPLAVSSTDAVRYSQLQDEANARIATDAQLTSDMANISVGAGDISDLANTVGMFGGAIANNAAGLAQEITDRTNADALINANVVTLSARLGQEVTDRMANDAYILSQITSDTNAIVQETAYRIANDALINANVATETAARIQGDLDLANSIGNSTAYVLKTGDTMTGGLTMNAALNMSASNPLYIGGTDSVMSYVLGLSQYNGSTLLLQSNNRTVAIETTGNIFLNPTTANSGLYVGTVGSARFGLDHSGDLSVTGNIIAGGDITAFGDVSWLSDMTLKYDIQTIPNALAKVQAMRGTSFKRADIEGNPVQIGVIAQEMMEVVPEVVHEGANGLYSVAYGNLVGVLIEAVKELAAEVAALKAGK